MSVIGEYLARLRDAPADLTEREITEALWLAVHMTGFRRHSGPSAQSQTTDRPADAIAAAPAVARRARSSGESASLWHPTLSVDVTHDTGRDAVPLRLSGPRELRHPLPLQRALRSLGRMTSTGRAAVLDEEASVECSADAGTVIPVLAQSSQRWLNLALVVDVGPSMILWDGLVAELHSLLTQLGAFRTIRTWDLRFDDGTATISPRTADGIRQGPKEIVDTTGRQAFLVVTDCVGEPWRSGVAMEALDIWARTGPVAIVQPLPQQMWHRSAVACHFAQLRSPRPGAPNGRLLVEQDGRSVPEGLGIPVPILEIGPQWFASWARLVSGTDRVDAVVGFTGVPGPEGDADAGTSSESLAEVSPRRIVERFMVGASPDAFRLAGFLAAAPLTLPLMRHIQRVMLPDSRPQQLAEVYLGGLLRSATPPGTEVGPARFEFLPGVRDVLLGTIWRSEAIRVAELVSAELSRSQGFGQPGFTALLDVDPGTTGRPLTATAKRYAQIETQVLRRIGGRYAEIADPGFSRPTAPGAALKITSLEPTPPYRPDPPQHDDRRGPAQHSGNDLRVHGITMWGAPGSGKTTLLAALGIALSRRGTDWNVAGANAASENMLIRFTRSLTRHTFPPPTSGIEHYRWVLNGQIGPTSRGRRRRRESDGAVAVALDLIDASGEITGSNQVGLPLRDELVDDLMRSRAIVLVFDPIREFEKGDAFEHTFSLLTQLVRRTIEGPGLTENRLDQHVAVCLSKFDDIRVLEAARKLDLIEFDEADPGFPRVADPHAREFFIKLYGLSRPGGGELITRLLEDFFRPERIHYFVTSAIGFYVDPRFGVYDPDDPVNLRPDDNAPQRGYIRGSVHPINVAEPLLSLGAQIATDPDLST